MEGGREAERVEQPAHNEVIQTLLEAIEQRVGIEVKGKVDKAFFENVLSALIHKPENQFTIDDQKIVSQILTLYAADFPQYIAKNISQTRSGLAWALYSDPDIKKSLGAGINDSALVVAARAQDHVALSHFLAVGTDQVLTLVNAHSDHPPALFVAVENADMSLDTKDQAKTAELLVEKGADVNVDYQGRTVVEIAINKNSLYLVRLFVSQPSFDWTRNANILKVAQTNRQSIQNTNPLIAKNIVDFLLEELFKKSCAVVSQLLDGHTLLTYTIVYAPEMTQKIIEGDLSNQLIGLIFEVDSQGRSPLFWARQMKRAGLQNDLALCYEKNIAHIIEFFLNSDPRVCKKSPGQSTCILVPNLVNDWLDLKQQIFDSLAATVERESTSCETLRRIQEEIKNPKTAIRQFFDCGEGGFWKTTSTWTAQFIALSTKIDECLLRANLVIDSSDESDLGYQEGEIIDPAASLDSP